MTPSFLAVEWSRGIEDAWSKVASFVPKFAGFLVILVVGYFVTKAIGKIADKVLERLGFDKAVERGGIKKALERSQYDASDIVSKIVFYTLFLLVLQMAFGVFGTNPISDMITGIVAYLPQVLVAIIIVVVASAIAAGVKEIVQASLGGLSYGRMLANVAATTIVGIGIFAALNQLQIAPAIVNGLFYAILAVVVGSAIIAIGGGGIVPMRQRWQNTLDRYDQEKPKIREQMQTARGRVEQRAEEVRGQARAEFEKSRETTPSSTTETAY